MSPPELTPEELAVLKLLVLGYRTSEVAKHLSLPYQTVAGTARRLKEVFKVATVAGLVAHPEVRDWTCWDKIK